MTLLIAGGIGFLGAYLTRYALREAGRKNVVILDKYPECGRIADVLDDVTLIKGDVVDTALLASIFKVHSIERVAHFAFIRGSPRPELMPAYIEVQCQGTVNLLEAARQGGVKRFMFVSSVAAYGVQEPEMLTEDLVAKPQNPYGFCKLWAETLVHHYATDFGLDTVSLRFGSTYGLGRASRGSYKSGLLTPPSQVHYMARVEEAVRGRPITMPGNNVVVDWTYAADAAQAAWLALTKDGLTYPLYNVSSARLPVGLFTTAMRQILPHADIAASKNESAGNAHPFMDNKRLVSDLGFAPAFNFQAGLSDYIDSIRILDKYNATHAV